MIAINGIKAERVYTKDGMYELKVDAIFETDEYDEMTAHYHTNGSMKVFEAADEDRKFGAVYEDIDSAMASKYAGVFKAMMDAGKIVDTTVE